MMKTQPDKYGHFGIFGGRYAAETLMPALIELEKAYGAAQKDKTFQKEFEWYQREYAGRATPLYYAQPDVRIFTRSKNIPETRRFKSYRLPQNKQHAGSGTPGPQDG